MASERLWCLLSLVLVMEVTTVCAEERVRVEPKEIDDLLANPSMGWETFHRFADEDPALEGLPSTVAYFRFYWKDLEPRPGQVNFEKLDRLLARARSAGQ